MSRVKGDPRQSIKYHRINAVIDLIQKKGPRTLDDICAALGFSYNDFRQARYSLPGHLAMEDRDVVIPRPVADEEYLYKLTDKWGVGTFADDGRPNVKMAVTDIVTRLATIYNDVDGLTTKIPGNTGIGRALRKLRRAMDSSLDKAEDVATISKSPVSEWAGYILESRP